MEKMIKGYWYFRGRKSGFGIGFDISKYGFQLDLGLWYMGVEF